METYEEKLAKALYVWKNLNIRACHPIGFFDRQGRWYPSDDEKKECCEKIRSPSARYPYSLMKHCRSVEHVANTFGVNISDLRREIHFCSLTK